MKAILFVMMVFSAIGFVCAISLGKSRESIVAGACLWGVAYCCSKGIVAIWDKEQVAKSITAAKAEEKEEE